MSILFTFQFLENSPFPKARLLAFTRAVSAFALAPLLSHRAAAILKAFSAPFGLSSLRKTLPFSYQASGKSGFCRVAFSNACRAAFSEPVSKNTFPLRCQASAFPGFSSRAF
jgi:hypothetical protein